MYDVCISTRHIIHKFQLMYNVCILTKTYYTFQLYILFICYNVCMMYVFQRKIIIRFNVYIMYVFQQNICISFNYGQRKLTRFTKQNLVMIVKGHLDTGWNAWRVYHMGPACAVGDILGETGGPPPPFPPYIPGDGLPSFLYPLYLLAVCIFCFFFWRKAFMRSEHKWIDIGILFMFS